MRNNTLKIIVVMLMAISLSGCTFILQKGRRSDQRRIAELSRQVDELSEAQRVLEERLAGEINDKQVKLERLGKGLVITFLADVLFDSGKASIKSNVRPTLDKVARVLQENVPDLNVGVEGHTDNQPIKYSGWKSNWELSAARALSVLHYLVDEKGVLPKRLKAEACGEYQPVASNSKKTGQQLNRRVEIIILPDVAKVKSTDERSGQSQKIK